MMIQVKYLPNRTFKILEISDEVFLIFYIYLNFIHIYRGERTRDSSSVEENKGNERKSRKKNEWHEGKKPQKRKLNSNCVSASLRVGECVCMWSRKLNSNS